MKKENEGQATVLVIDDDDAMRDSLCCLMDSMKLACRTYSSALDFLKISELPRLGCILLDIRMPGMSGMELLENLKERRNPLPVIIITGHGDVPLAVQAIKLGAFDFVQKPFSAQLLLERVQAALDMMRDSMQNNNKLEILRSQFETLTEREREIMELVVAGSQSKAIGIKLGISPRTVDIHRSAIMRKLGIRTVAELVQSRLSLWPD
jgi:FixJ family two-component response regulator